LSHFIYPYSFDVYCLSLRRLSSVQSSTASVGECVGANLSSVYQSSSLRFVGSALGFSVGSSVGSGVGSSVVGARVVGVAEGVSEGATGAQVGQFLVK